MSHNKERKEKDCLNCGADLAGRYCHVCGQENIEPKETVLGLISHFFSDITHFDGKFFSTVKYLITKPGFLSAEYLKGRRARYLHPIRMYVFTSAFFFIIFFSFFNAGNLLTGQKGNEEQLKELKEASSSLKEDLPQTRDSVLKSAIARSIISIDKHIVLLQQQEERKKKKDSAVQAMVHLKLDSVKKNTTGFKELSEKLAKNEDYSKKNNDSGATDSLRISRNTNITIGDVTAHSAIAYDSVQKELPENKRDGWYKKLKTHKVILLNSKWKNNKDEAAALFMEKFMHTLPQALFVSIPLFALLLLILYARRKFYYADHGIFAIHLYCAIFILLFIYFFIDKMLSSFSLNWLMVFKVVIVLGMFFYLYKAMRRFYGQRRFKTIMKFSILLFFSLILFSFLTTLFLLLSFLQFS